MPKLTAIKVLKTSIIPVVAVLAVKISSLFLISFFTSSPWKFVWDNPSFKYYLFGFDRRQNLLLVSNWSDLITVLFIATWFSWLIFKANYLNESNVHPNLASRLYRASFSFLIGKTEVIYHQLTVWLVLVWTYLIFLTNSLVNGYISAFIYGIGISLVLVITAEIFVFEKSVKN